MKFLSQVKNLSGKTVLLRADLDAPHKGGKVLDSFRIKMALATIQYLHGAGAKLIIISKSGKPKGAPESADSLQPQAEILANLLGKQLLISEQPVADESGNNLIFFKGSLNEQQNIETIKNFSAKSIILLENIRFYPGELNNDPAFAKALASLGDIYVNDAFAMMHRSEASVTLLPHYLPAYAGLNVEKELQGLERLLKLKAAPFLVIMGGAKISDKVGAIRNLGKMADKILIGGGPANLFLLAKGYEIGKSLCERDQVELAVELLRNFKEKIVLPLDFVVAEPDNYTGVRVCQPKDIKKNEAALDIGPKTILAFSQYIKSAKKMVWNGPMGMFEKPVFAHGTRSLALLFAGRCKGFAYGVVGGGDTLEAINAAKVADQIDFVSTAGSATLDFLAGDELPGLRALQ